MHAAGVLHRDVKPSNVLMEGRTPVLIDFGLARVADDPRLTQTGWLLGTPGYLAARDPVRRRRDPRLRRALAGRRRWRSPAPAGRRTARGPSMAIMDRVRRGEHDLTGLPAALRRSWRPRSTPSRPAGPASTASASC